MIDVDAIFEAQARRQYRQRLLIAKAASTVALCALSGYLQGTTGDAHLGWGVFALLIVWGAD